MLSSQTGAALSGAGSAAGKSAGHGAVLMGAGVRTGFARGLGPLQAGAMGLGMPGRFEPDKEGPPHVCSGSDADSDSGDENEPMGSIGDNRRGGGVKRERAEMEAAMVGQEAGLPSAALAGGAAGAKPGKKTRGRVKIKMEFIDNKLRRYTTFSKRKTGIMKKAYELSTLTGTQVLLLVASETGHVYTFATRKLQPMITSETGKALIQTCLNSPDSPPRSDPSTDQRMSATGFEETDLTYQVSESESLGETKCSWCDDALHQRCSSSQDALKPVFTVASVASSSSAPPTVSGNGANGTLLKSGGLMQLPAGFTFMSGSPFAPGTPAIPLGQSITASSSPQGQQAVFRLPATVSLTAPVQLHQHQLQQSGDLSEQHSHHSQSPSNHRHVISAHLHDRSHDVFQPTHGHVRISAHASRREPSCAQRLHTGIHCHAGVTRTDSGHGRCSSGVPHSSSWYGSDSCLGGAASSNGDWSAVQRQQQ
ncbi:serum response factor-like isoform X6 [Sinocyclocheilus rhinocerous]|uniref:serum response factor-like isoform X6 n=1 Tax=Sinocyclocheilus rhinocerous TaxID=307959 RepID=UPI0007B8A240|nr:PREDICTED: serum response factor-like isoform X6 [Sinocyclocheilus rhinocerous]